MVPCSYKNVSCVLDPQLYFLARLTNLTPLCLKHFFYSASGSNPNEASETETDEEHCLASRRQAEEDYVLLFEVN